MSYEEAIRELSKIVSDAWKEIDSGFYPELDEEIKLLNIQKRIKDGYLEEGFWDLVRVLIKDPLTMSEEDLPEEQVRPINVLKELIDQANVQQWLTKLKTESQIGEKTMGIIESLQKNLIT